VRAGGSIAVKEGKHEGRIMTAVATAAADLAADSAEGAFRGVDAAELAAWKRVSRSVADQLAATAPEREKAGGDPVSEVGLLRTSGLLGFAAPAALGGAGGSLAQALGLLRVVAGGDGAVGQLLASHYCGSVASWILGTRAQWERTARGVGELGWLQAGAAGGRGSQLELTRDGGGFRISGPTGLVTGAALADTVMVAVPDHGRLMTFEVPLDRIGITIGDRDAPGARLTASGRLRFDDVFAGPDELLAGLSGFPGDQVARSALRARFRQLALVHLSLGLAEGALIDAAGYSRRRPPSGGAGQPGGPERPEPAAPGRAAAVSAAADLADHAAGSFERALAAGPAMTRAQWRALTVGVGRAVSAAAAASLEAAGGCRAALA
jgi:alkylation response protein AidB-like acyl-CoA dehydrogenase